MADLIAKELETFQEPAEVGGLKFFMDLKGFLAISLYVVEIESTWYPMSYIIVFIKFQVMIFFSAHGVPVSYVEDAGDPYKDQMEECIYLIMQELKARGIDNKHTLAYQVREEFRF